MRCRFASIHDKAEQAALSRFDARAARFFQALREVADLDLLEAELGAVDDGFEFIGAWRRGTELTLDVRAEAPVRPRLERFAGLCPAGVSVVTERGARPFERVQNEVRSVTGHDLVNARVRAGITRGHLLDVVVYLTGCTGSSDIHAAHAAELAVEGCLGERVVDDWVSSITSAPLPKSQVMPLRLVQNNDELAKTFDLVDLRQAVDRTVHGVHEALPAEPLHAAEQRSDWVMLEVETGEGDSSAQADLLLTSTFLPEMLKCFLQGSPFSSVRFSRHGERFAYLKYQATGGLREKVSTRQTLEDALDAGLRAQALGSVVGNGVGHGHCYVDLALGDVDRALLEISAIARHVGVPSESWILFCDSEWQREWVGVWEHTRAPFE
jgi:hypothetical protein